MVAIKKRQKKKKRLESILALVLRNYNNFVFTSCVSVSQRLFKYCKYTDKRTPSKNQ